MRKIVCLLIILAMLVTIVPAALALDMTDAPSGNAAADSDSKFTLQYKPETNGTLTITVGDGSTNWSSDVIHFGASWEIVTIASASGSDQTTYTADLTAGTSYYIRIWETSGDALSATPYSISFAEGSGGSGGVIDNREKYVLSAAAVSVGTNEVTVEADRAYTTIYVFSPAAAGVYTVTAPDGVLLGYWGGTTSYIFDATGSDKTNSLEITLTNSNQSALIGVTNTDITATTLTITKTDDAGEKQYTVVTYENAVTPVVFQLPEGAAIGEYVDVYSGEHTAHKGDDGYYHLDSADGPILLVDMDYRYVLSDALTGGRQVMYVPDVENLINYDIGNAVLAYEAACDENGYYPLTEDLIYFYQDYASNAGVYSFCLENGYNEDCAWMFACITMTIPGDSTAPTDPAPTDPAPTDPIPADPAPTDPIPTDPAPTDPIPTDPTPTDPAPTVPDDSQFQVGELLLGDNRVELAAGDNDGETWTFTASESGKLTIAVTQLENYDEYNGIWNDGTEYLSSLFYRQWYWLLVNGDSNSTESYTLNVEAGEEVIIQLYTFYGYHTKATINLTLGTEQDSSEPTDPEPTEPEGSEPDATEPEQTQPDDSSSGSEWETTWTAPEDGILTMTVSGIPGWAYKYYHDGIWSVLHTGSVETAVTLEVRAGEVYTFAFWPYNVSEWDFANGTISYDLSFESAELGQNEKVDDYVISSQVLELGSNQVSLEDTAYLTAYKFVPTETGTYTFTAPLGVELCHYGTAIYPYNVTTSSGQEMTNTLTITITAVGQSALIGVNNAELILTDTTITVEKTASYVEKVVELEVYENQTTPVQFQLPEGAVIGEYVNVYGDTHTAVYGEDGYYHLDSADGPILLVDMDYLAVLTDALNEGRGIMYAYVVDENGTILAKYDIEKAIKAYESNTDANGYYPLTSDLIFFYDTYAAGSGTFEYYLDEGYNPECAWMFACVTMTLTADDTGTSDDVSPKTGDASSGLLIAAAVICVMSIAALPKVKKYV